MHYVGFCPVCHRIYFTAKPKFDIKGKPFLACTGTLSQTHNINRNINDGKWKCNTYIRMYSFPKKRR